MENFTFFLSGKAAPMAPVSKGGMSVVVWRKAQRLEDGLAELLK